MSDQMNEALDRMADHRSAAMKVDRTGWSTRQWADDAERLMNDLDGSVSSLVNGHVMALLRERREVRDLIHHLDGFLGLIVHRGDTDEEQARELLDRVTELTRA